MRAIVPFVAATLCFVAFPAHAQEAPLVPPPPAPDAPMPVTADSPNTDDGSDFHVLGIGVGLLPDYEGSNDYTITPVPGATGRISGFNYLLAGNRLSVDLIPDGVGPTIDFQAGPIAVVNFNRSRTRGIHDPRIKALGEVDTAIEVGGYVGIGKTGVFTSEFDRLSVSLSVRKDVAGAHDSTIIAPTVNYLTPLSARALVGVFVSAEHVGEGYADTYFSINQVESSFSGLPTYNARRGWKNWTAGLMAGHSLTGDLRSGLQLFGGGVYRRMLNDFGNSPLTRIAGSRDQWLGVVGLAYSF